jgi:hypothetical protein
MIRPCSTASRTARATYSELVVPDGVSATVPPRWLVSSSRWPGNPGDHDSPRTFVRRAGHNEPVITALGRDGRPLVDTRQAAYSLGMKPPAFREWARRRGLRAAGQRPTGGPGRPPALWDLADIADALRDTAA